MSSGRRSQWGQSGLFVPNLRPLGSRIGQSPSTPVLSNNNRLPHEAENRQRDYPFHVGARAGQRAAWRLLRTSTATTGASPTTGRGGGDGATAARGGRHIGRAPSGRRGGSLILVGTDGSSPPTVVVVTASSVVVVVVVPSADVVVVLTSAIVVLVVGASAPKKRRWAALTPLPISLASAVIVQSEVGDRNRAS